MSFQPNPFHANYFLNVYNMSSMYLNKILFKPKISISSRNIINLQFAEDTDAIAEEKQEQETLVESLNKTCTWYKMEVSAEVIKLMTNSSNAIQMEIKVKEQKLGTITSFIKYLRAVVSDHGPKPKPQILSRIAQAAAALTKLKTIWRERTTYLLDQR